MNNQSPVSFPARKNTLPLARIQRGLLALSTMVSKITTPLYLKRGFTEVRILSDWPTIVGERFAAFTLPEKLVLPRGNKGVGKRDGLLHVRVEGPLATELQHLEPQIVERINGYFGYSAVARLKLIHGPIPPMSQPTAVQSQLQANPHTKRAMEKMTSGIANTGLRAVLTDLGCAVAAKQERKEAGKSKKKGGNTLRDTQKNTDGKF